MEERITIKNIEITVTINELIRAERKFILFMALP
jgi:hypothetical protein